MSLARLPQIERFPGYLLGVAREREKGGGLRGYPVIGAARGERPLPALRRGEQAA